MKVDGSLGSNRIGFLIVLVRVLLGGSGAGLGGTEGTGVSISGFDRGIEIQSGGTTGGTTG